MVEQSLPQASIKTFNIKNLSELKVFAQQDLLEINKTNTNSDLVFLFFAPMGAGKTTLIREFGQALKIKENITSPTFVGMNEYHCEGFNFYHFDLYQVGIKFEDLAEIFSSSTRNILVVEWAEKLEPAHLDYLNKNCTLIKINISVNPDESRIIELA